MRVLAGSAAERNYRKLPRQSKADEWRFRGHESCKQLTILTVEQLSRDSSFGQVRQFRKGSYVWRADDKADRIYSLVRGQVSILAVDSEGHEVIVHVIGAGQTFGELCFCSQEHGLYGNVARVVKEAEAIEIGFENFLGYLQDRNDALAALVFTFCARLAETQSRIEILSYRGAEDRLARLLLHLAASRGSPSSKRSGQVVFAVSHDELSMMAAMTRPHVSVTMGKLRSKGFVHYTRGSQLVLNVSRLASLVHKART